jgi:UDP-N-acetylmuramoylalanine--D-glutamate ligase
MESLTKNYKGFFKGKKITILGLGLLGRGIGDVIFLAKEGADLVVTDLKTKEQLASSLEKIKKEVGPDLYKKINFVLGEHRLQDFQNRDFILKAAGVPLNSPFVAEARKKNISIKMDASWFVELAPEDVKIIGVTGTRGKSTVTHLIHEIMISTKINGGLPSAKSVVCCNNVWLGGNVRGLATLPLLKKVKAGDIVVMELDSWQLQGFGDSKISPNISVFTNLMVDHQNYYGSMGKYFSDKANIFLNQKEGDSLICGKEVLNLIRKKSKKFAGRAIVPDTGVVPKSWKVKLLGEHNRLNIAYAVTVARILDIPEKVIKRAVENYTGVPGRLEFVGEVRGVKYYNDTTATTPDGVMAALKALGDFPEGNPLKASQGLPSKKPRIILLGGGRDKELDYKKYAPVVKKSVKALALFAGTGSDKIIKSLGNTKLPARIGLRGGPVKVFDSMPSAFAWANGQAKKGDIVLLSPGAASFGVFKNEFDRGDQFVAQVKKLKKNE